MDQTKAIETSNPGPDAGAQNSGRDNVLLRMPMVVPKFAGTTAICLPLGMAYIASAMRNAGFNVRCVDAVGEDPFKRIVLENSNFLTFGLSTPEIV